MSSATSEQEAKFRVSDTFAVPFLGGHGVRQVLGDARTLDATYWDTPDMRLARRGHTLRYRASDDDSENKWTLKLGGRGRSSLLQRREVDGDGEAESPPKELVDALTGVVGKESLVAVARMRTNRDKYGIDDADGHRLLNVDDDRVQLFRRGRSVGSFREVELELADPDQGGREFSRMTRLLRDAGAGKPDPMPKLERVVGPTAQRERPPTLRRRSTIEQLVSAAVRGGLDQLLLHDPAVRLNLGPEDVHQARVATRRLRANLRTLRPLLDRRAVDQLREEIGWAGRALGQVRDLDVLHESFVSACEDDPNVHGAALIAVVDAERADAYRKLTDAMHTARWQSMLDALDVAAVLPPLGSNVAPTSDARRAARKLLRKSWRRLERQADEARTTTGGWHEVRKAAKSTRYAAELLEPLLGTRAKRLAKDLTRIQTQLGKEQDRVIALAWLEDHRLDGSIAGVAERLIAHYEGTPDRKPPRWNRRWKRARSTFKKVT